MKTKLLLALLFITAVSTNNISAQNVKSISIENIDKEVVWPAVFKAFKELKLPRPLIATQQGTGETGFYNYKSLMIKNRLRFKINYQENKLTISIFERQYYTNTGWVDNPLPISKKRVRKILNPIKDRIVELTKNKTITSINNNIQPKKETKIIKKAGIFEEFVIIKTNDQKIEVLTLYKNGNLIGFDLWEDKKTVKALLFKENKDSEAVTLEFDKNGLPTYMGIENLNIKIKSNTSGELNLSMKDIDGNFIGEKEIIIKPLPSHLPTDVFIEEKKNHGGDYYSESPEFNQNLSDCMGNALTALSGIIASIQGPRPLLLELIKESATVLGIGISDPDNKYNLNELSTLIGLIGTEATLAAATTSLAVTAPGLLSCVPYLIAATVTLAGLKISYDAWIRIKERHWPTPKIVINKASEPIQTGSFGEYRLSSGYIAVEYNYPNEAINIISEHNDDLKFKFSSTDTLNGYVKTYFNVSAKESINKKHHITAFYIIKHEKYIVNGEKISEEIEIQIEEPKYYYLKNCNDCSDDPSHKQECEERLEQCISSIKAEDHIYFVLDENDKIIDCNKDLNDARKSFVKSSTLDNHGFKSFVTEAHCSYNCEGSVDKQTIISLAHEAMGKIKKIEDKIKGLQSVANETNYLKIGAEIQTLEKSIQPIKEKYIAKINKIAEKRTISYNIKQTDPANYYSTKSLTVYSSHWSNNNISILLDVSYIRKYSEKEVKIYGGGIKTYLEDLRELRFYFQYLNNTKDLNYTIPVFGKTNASFAISFNMFEKETDYVNFFASKAKNELKE